MSYVAQHHEREAADVSYMMRLKRACAVACAHTNCHATPPYDWSAMLCVNC